MIQFIEKKPYKILYSLTSIFWKRILKFFVIYCLTLIVSFPAYSQNCKFVVEIKILPQLKNVFENEEVHIKLLSDSLIDKSTFIKYGKGQVTFDSIKITQLNILLSSFIKKSFFEKDYSLNTSFKRNDNDTTFYVTLTFPKRCAYNMNGINRICPKCHKKDKVIPILYGLRIPSFDDKGKLIGEPEYMSGVCGISNCDPSWYCKRNKLRF